MIGGTNPPSFDRPSAFADLPPLSWRDKTLARSFYCDAFISHRRGDTSDKLRLALEAQNVRAWHDGNADLTHRKVRDHIRFALSSARTIIAFIDQNASLSDWCRAECEPGLLAGTKGNFERVIVVLREQGLAVPKELLGCRTFLTQDIGQLADYLKDANRPPLVNEQAIRSWVAPHHVLGTLPFGEVATLGVQRLDLIARTDSDDPWPWEEWSRDLLATDLGVRVGGGWLDGIDIPVAAEEPLLTLYTRLGSALLERKDVLVRLAPFEIVDFVLAPLGWLQTNRAYAASAHLLFAKLCLAVAENSDYAQLAAAWLTLPESIEKNPNLAEARMAMWETLDDAYKEERHLKSVSECASLKQRKLALASLQRRQSAGIEYCRLAVSTLAAAPL
jgi:TIR domain